MEAVQDSEGGRPVCYTAAHAVLCVCRERERERERKRERHSKRT